MVAERKSRLGILEAPGQREQGFSCFEAGITEPGEQKKLSGNFLVNFLREGLF